MATGIKSDFYEKIHKKNLPAFVELGKRVAREKLQIADIRVDEPEFGLTRVIIYVRETEKNNG